MRDIPNLWNVKEHWSKKPIAPAPLHTSLAWEGVESAQLAVVEHAPAWGLECAQAAVTRAGVWVALCVSIVPTSVRSVLAAHLSLGFVLKHSIAIPGCPLSP